MLYQLEIRQIDLRSDFKGAHVSFNPGQDFDCFMAAVQSGVDNLNDAIDDGYEDGAYIISDRAHDKVITNTFF